MSITGKCKIDGCVTNTRIKSGFCGKHYQKFRKYGDPLFKRYSLPTSCKIEGCGNRGTLKKSGKRYFHRGYCGKHYVRVYNGASLERVTRVLGAKANHPLTNTWHGMMRRCYRTDHKSYPYYGALGVKVCERWHSFDNFINDLGDKPQGTTLDRKDPYGDYEPSNCRWATPKEQANNKRKHKTP